MNILAIIQSFLIFAALCAASGLSATFSGEVGSLAGIGVVVVASLSVVGFVEGKFGYAPRKDVESEFNKKRQELQRDAFNKTVDQIENLGFQVVRSSDIAKIISIAPKV